MMNANRSEAVDLLEWARELKRWPTEGEQREWELVRVRALMQMNRKA